jgi:N-ethylmaleimide reductase
MINLLEKYDLSSLKLSNRFVMAPMTRSRAPQDIATEQIALNYTQRGTAGLIVSEGTPTALLAGGCFWGM